MTAPMPMIHDFQPGVAEDGLPLMPVFHMRGGTSTGIVLWGPHLPEPLHLREELVRHLMGVPQQGRLPGNRQITGLGRTVATSNKVFIVDPHDGDDADFDSTLAQLAADHGEIDWRVNCGNMSAALPMYLLECGLLKATAAQTRVRIWNTNTRKLTRMSLPTPYEMASIPGVPGRFPSVELTLQNPVGAKTGQLFPTGRRQDQIQGIAVSCLDVAVPMVIVRASDLGCTARESVASLQSDSALIERLRAIWVEAGLLMQLKSAQGEPMTAQQLAASETVPKICMVACGDDDADLHVRYFTPQTPHASMAVTGGCCLAVAALLEGTVASELISSGIGLTPQAQETVVRMANPAGVLQARVFGSADNQVVDIPWVAYQRTAQVLLRGLAPIYQPSDELRRFFASFGGS